MNVNDQFTLENQADSDAIAEHKDSYDCSEKELEVVSTVTALFRDAMDQRDRSFEYLDNRTPVEYWEDSVRRFYTNYDEREGIDDWQSVLHDPFTRNKLLAIMGRVVDALPTVEITGRGEDHWLKGEIVGALFEYAEDVGDADQIMVDMIQDCLVKGTVVGFEGIETKTDKRRTVVNYKDGDDLTVKTVTVKKRRLISTLVPLEEFYPSSMGIKRIKDMPFAFWRSEMPLAKFAKDFQNYEKSQYVKGFENSSNATIVPRPYYLDYISPTTKDGNVEVIRYFNQETDEYVLIANGIWLNPLQGEIVSPIPFNHKNLPFFEIRYDNYGHDFFLGKSFPDRISVLQDTLNVLHNMLLDQSFLSILSPIIMAGADDIEDDFLVPGRRIAIDTGGLPINQAVMKLDMGTPTGWHQWIMEYTKRVLEESSIDSVSGGSAGVGGRTTAEEIRRAAEGVTSLLGLFGRYIKFGVKERARLRVANILQFYFDPKQPIHESIGSLTDWQREDPNIFNRFYVNSEADTPGTRGTKRIDVYKDGSDLPTDAENAIKAEADKVFSGTKVERFSVTPKFFENFEACIKIVPNAKSETSKSTDRALEVQFQQTMNSLYPDLIDRREMAALLVQKYGRDPSKVLKEEQPQQPAIPGMGPDGATEMVPGGGGDNSPNVIKGATGVGGEGFDMRQLMQ